MIWRDKEERRLIRRWCYLTNMDKQIFSLNNFVAGLVTKYPDTRVPDNAFSDCQDIELTDKGLPTKIRGHSKYNAATIGAAPIRGGCVYSQSSGTKHYVVACNGKIWYSVANSGTWMAYQIAGVDMTIDSNSDVEFAVYNDILYAVNGKYPVITNAGYTTSRMIKITNITVTALTDTNIPQYARHLIIHQERLFADDNTNGLYWTEAFDAEDWTPAYGVNYDYAGKNDGEIISGLISYGGYVYVGKLHNIYRYSTLGDISEWGAVRVDTKLGFLYQRTVKEFYGYLMYLSPEGVVRFDGNNAQLIDDVIRDKILALPQMIQAARQWLLTTIADWQTGTYGNQIDTSADEIKQLAQTTQDDWTVAERIGVNISNVPGSVELTGKNNGKYQTAVVNNGQIYVSSDYGATWTAKDSVRNWRGVSVSADGKYQTAVVNNGQIYVSSDYGATWTAKDSVRNWRGVSVSADGKYQTAVVNNGQIYVSSDYGATWTAKDSVRNWSGVSVSGGGYGIIITQTINYGAVPTSLGDLSAQVNCPANCSIEFLAETRTADSGWGTYTSLGTATSTGNYTVSLVGLTVRQYVKIKAILRYIGSSEDTPVLYSINIGGQWRSPVKDLTVTPVSWGRFDANYLLNSQTVTFWMRSAATSDGVASATWYQQTPGIVVSTVTLNRYIQTEVRFNTTDYSQIPSVQDINVNYNLTTTTVQPCAGVWKDKYWLNVADTGQSINNLVYLYDRRDYWLKRTNKKNNIYFIDEDKLLSGTSESDGFVRYNDTGSQDDTTDIDSWFETRNFELTGMVNLFRDIYITAKADANFTVSYKIDDGSYTAITITSQSYVKTVRKVFTGITRGQKVKFKIEQANQDANFEFHKLDLEWRPLRRINA